MSDAPPVAPKVPRSTVHAALARVASAHGCRSSSFANGVSVHRLAESVALTSIKNFADAAEEHKERAFIGTVEGTMVMSVNFNHEPRPALSLPAASKSKKRRRDPHEEASDHTVQRVKRGLPNDSGVTDEMLAAAQKSLHTLLSTLRGAHGEVAVESYGLSFKSLEKGGSFTSSVNRPRLILSVRLAPGVAIPVQALLDALGPASKDGMLTTQEGGTLANGFDLPLSEQAKASITHGQKSISVFATVCA